MVRWRTFGNDSRRDKRLIDISNAPTTFISATDRLLGEDLRRRRRGKFTDGLEALALNAAIEVGDLYAAVVVDPAALVPIAPGHGCPHPARVEIELQRIGTKDEDAADHAATSRSRGLDAGVVKLHDRLGRNRIDRDEIPAAFRLRHARHPGRCDAPVEAIVVEEDPLALLRVHLILLQIWRGKELEIVEVLIRQHRHPVTGMGRHD